MEENRGVTITWVTILLASMTAVVVTLRLWARAFIVKSVGVDDGLICVAALMSWGLAVAALLSVRDGLGSHIDDIPLRGEENLLKYNRVVWLGTLFYYASLGFTKLSISALYMRLGDVTLTRLSIAMSGIIGCHTIGSIVVCVFQLFPVKAERSNYIVADVSHFNIEAFYLANSVIGIVTDIVTNALPLRLITKLQIPRRQKVGLVLNLCIGFFACVSSIVRLTHLPLDPPRADPTWIVAPVVEWSVIEVNVGILAASIPSYKSIVKRYTPSILGSYGEKTSKCTSGNTSRFRRIDNRPAVAAVELSEGGGHERRLATANSERDRGTTTVNSSEEALYAVEPWA